MPESEYGWIVDDSRWFPIRFFWCKKPFEFGIDTSQFLFGVGVYNDFLRYAIVINLFVGPLRFTIFVDREDLDNDSWTSR